MPYWTQTDLENRLSAEVVRQILDDDNNGTADTGAVAMLQVDSDSYVEGYLRGIYSLDAVRLDPPNQVKRLSLDCAVMYAAQRHPRYVKRDWQPLKEALDADLLLLRKGLIRLDVEGSPEPGANEGGKLMGRTIGCPPRKVFIGGMGDF